MTLRPPLELRMRWFWRIVIATAVPAFAAMIVGGSVAILSAGQGPFGGILGVAFLALILGGLIVVPGTAVLARLARGAPDVRIDTHGIVWGNDRSRDLAIDWSDVEGVASAHQRTQYMTDRLFVIRTRPGRTPNKPQTIYGRLMAMSNRIITRSPFAISTMTTDQPWDEIRATIEAHLGRPVEDG